MAPVQSNVEGGPEADTGLQDMLDDPVAGQKRTPHLKP